MQQTVEMVGYCYNKYVCWSGASVSDIHACRHKFIVWFGCLLDATIKDMGNVRVQLLQTWLMVGCKYNIHGC